MSELKKLDNSFYTRPDPIQIAKELLGKILITCFNDVLTSGRIVETEAYAGVTDRASHAFGGRRTRRTETMYHKGGTAYVFLCYGMHHLFNIVTNEREIPHAILIRSVEPLQGIETMLERGPGNVSKALGLSTQHSAKSLLSNQIFLADDGYRVAKSQIGSTPRIGVDYAGEDAMLPYRFMIKENKYVSGKRVGY